MQSANLALRFGLELVSLVAVACWAWVAAATLAGKICAALAAPLAVAVIWTVIQGESVPGAVQLLAQVAVFAAAAAAILRLGRPRLAAAFVVVSDRECCPDDVLGGMISRLDYSASNAASR